ncbi:hypothetical protein [Nonomuraea sp. NPDC049607]|uniref:hypothetical protein n=1 Tax=Nonomuraea sp. NPDC049607 TaxID=3154732 RepID=UPI003425BE8E
MATHDRRHIELSLIPDGARLGQEITKIEDDLYRSIDAAAEGRDLEQLFGFLRAFVADLPAGQALARRTSP